MKYKEVTVGRSETLPQKEPFSSTKLFHQITVEVCENENIASVVEQLHQQCQKMLDEAKKKNGNGKSEKPATIETKNNTNVNDKLKSAAGLMKETKNNNNDNGSNNGNGSKLRDTRNRPVRELLDELKIKSETQANFLRWNEKISYNEWLRLHDWFNNKEIISMARQ